MKRHSTKKLAALAAGLLFAVQLSAQQEPNQAKGFDPGKLYASFAEPDNINVFNGNLVITLPLGAEYPVGGALSYRLNLIYNGQLWRYREDGSAPEAYPDPVSNAGLGWQVTLGELGSPSDPMNTAPGNWGYTGPDGSTKVFYGTLHPEEKNTPYAGVTSGNGVVGYTRDGSYLRLVHLGGRIVRLVDEGGPHSGVHYAVWVFEYAVEFPDGTRHIFTSEEVDGEDQATPPAEIGLHYRISRMEDRFGNYVAVTYSEDGLTWTLTDRHGRVQKVNFTPQTFYQYRGTAQSRNLVTSIELSAFNGQTATYSFEYSDYVTISEPCDDGFANGTADNPIDRTDNTRFLDRIVLPDGSAYAMLYRRVQYSSDPARPTLIVCDKSSGHLQTLTLPTGGRIEYTLTQRAFPHRKEEFNGFGSLTAETRVDHSTAVETRTVIDGANSSTWTYSSHLRNQGTYNIPTTTGGFAQGTLMRSMVVVQTDPVGQKTASYFTVDKIGDEGCYPGGNENEYGLPYTHSAGTNVGNYLLSTETFAAGCETPFNFADQRCGPSSCTVLRRTYVQYEMDTGDDGYGTSLELVNHNWRVKGSRTEFRDDTGCLDANNEAVVCATETLSSDFDGLGHYRTNTTTTNFPGAKSHTTYTKFNPSRGSYVPNGGSVPSSYMVATASPWLLNLYDRVDSTEGPRTETSQYCFEATTGFLSGTRRWKSTAAGVNDLVTIYDKDTSGNVSGEAFYGGDVHPLPALYQSCTPAPTSAYDYKLVHSYAGGALLTSKYSGLTFFNVNISRDANTALPYLSSDSAQVTTQYVFDSSGRLTEVRPSSGAWTEYVYSTAAYLTTVFVKQWPFGQLASGSPLTEKRLYFDGIGRVTREAVRMPSGNWSVSQTLYDALGRKSQVSEPKSYVSPPTSAFTPAAWTTYGYDRFSRPKTITGPDGRSVSTTYTGTRLAVRESCVATGTTGGDCPQSSFGNEELASTTSTYDAFGRLIQVVEPGSNSTTDYGYDVANRLVSVDMAGTDVVQERRFTYDLRGFLTDERHPEKGPAGNGTVHYSKFDAKGHATEQIEGTVEATRLTFAYDTAERLQTLKETLSQNVIKSFEYGTDNPAGDLHLGKLKTATRHNRIQNGGAVTDIVVTDAYEYGDAAGRLTAKTTTAVNGGYTIQSFRQGYSYTELGNIDTITYPTCTFTGCSGTSALSALQHTYDNGRLVGIGTYGSVDYHTNGLVHNVTHKTAAGATTPGRDDQEVSSGGIDLPRPASITFTDLPSCALPSPNITPASASICAGSASSASVNQETATTYTWSIVGGSLSSPATGSAVTFTANASGQVTLTVNASNSCGNAAPVSAVIGIVVLPTITQQPQSVTIVTGSQATLQAAASGTNISWQWYRGNSGDTSNPIAGATASTYVVSPAVTTTYWVRAGTGACTVDSAAATVTVCTPPSPVITVAGSSVCANSLATASVSQQPGVSYTWSISGGQLSTYTGSQVTFTADSSGVVTLGVFATGTCGSTNAAPVTLTIVGRPVITQQPQSAFIMSGSQAALQAVASGTNLTWQWYLGTTGDTSSPLSGATSSVYNASPPGTTQYWVRVYSEGLCATDSATATVTVTPLLAAATNLLATTQADPSVVQIQWDAISNAAGYRVKRRTIIDGTMTSVGSAPTTALTVTDTVPTAAGPIAYIYVVVGVDAYGNESPSLSNADYALTGTALFTDEPLHAPTDPAGGTLIRGRHVLELRKAIDALRVAVKLLPFWSNPTAPEGLYNALDYSSLKAPFDAARQELGKGAFNWTGVPAPASQGLILRAHVQQLRDALR